MGPPTPSQVCHYFAGSGAQHSQVFDLRPLSYLEHCVLVEVVVLVEAVVLAEEVVLVEVVVGFVLAHTRVKSLEM